MICALYRSGVGLGFKRCRPQAFLCPIIMASVKCILMQEELKLKNASSQLTINRIPERPDMFLRKVLQAQSTVAYLIHITSTIDWLTSAQSIDTEIPTYSYNI